MKLYWIRKYGELHLEKCLDLEPGNSTAYMNLGTIHLQNQEIEDAISEFTQAIRLNPYDASFYLARGYVYSQVKDSTRAISDLNQVMKFSEDSQLRQAVQQRLNWYASS